MNLITMSIDPGTRGCGVAFWAENSAGIKRLHRAEYIKNPATFKDASKDFGPKQAASMANELWRHTVQLGYNVALVVAEWPQTYGGRSSEGDTNDLFGIAGVSAAVAARFGCGEPYLGYGPVAGAAFFRPHDWKGSAKKPDKESEPYVVEAKVMRELEAAEAEKIIWPTRKKLTWDVTDAIGIGLKCFGRFEKKRAYVFE